ncbi:hypothetical protein [Sphingobium algorifonticola]|uniref:Uncharacterized protein n=1 Tax=Sphingobium algorifonticola TaxID=2008318 RepID=A0A437J4Z1_9SPHN|nr:hypothetical protein [Sphingobium algorifonticola]RVT39782.1 hypothetical protein ENE74_13605 [Sphingobium algorifonticola]
MVRVGQAGKTTERMKAIAKELAEIDRTTSQVVDCIVETKNRTVIRQLENKLSEMEQPKLPLAENIAKCGTPVRNHG